MKSILLLVKDIHFKGGGERVASNFATHYAERGYPVTILSMDVKKTNTLYPVHQNVKIDYLSVHHTKIISKMQVFIKLCYYFRHRSFNYILGIGTYSNVFLGFLPNKSNGIFIGCEHSSWNSASFIWKIMKQLSYPQLHALITLTEHDLIFAKMANKNCYVIPNSIEPIIQTSALIKKNILAVGQLYYTKGFDLMLDVFKEFIEYNQDWLLTIIGDGESRHDLEQQIQKLNLEKYVKLLSSTDKIYDYYLTSSIFLMTSRHEGFPMVLLEAQAFGIPVIAYDCKTGPSEIIEHNKSGFIVPFGDKSKMVEALTLLCSDDKLRLVMGQNAKQNVKRFSPEIVYKMWDELFEKL